MAVFGSVTPHDKYFQGDAIVIITSKLYKR